MHCAPNCGGRLYICKSSSIQCLTYDARNCFQLRKAKTRLAARLKRYDKICLPVNYHLIHRFHRLDARIDFDQSSCDETRDDWTSNLGGHTTSARGDNWVSSPKSIRNSSIRHQMPFTWCWRKQSKLRLLLNCPQPHNSLVMSCCSGIKIKNARQVFHLLSRRLRSQIIAFEIWSFLFDVVFQFCWSYSQDAQLVPRRGHILLLRTHLTSYLALTLGLRFRDALGLK